MSEISEVEDSPLNIAKQTLNILEKLKKEAKAIREKSKTRSKSKEKLKKMVKNYSNVNLHNYPKTSGRKSCKANLLRTFSSRPRTAKHKNNKHRIKISELLKSKDYGKVHH